MRTGRNAQLVTSIAVWGLLAAFSSFVSVWVILTLWLAQ